LKLSLLFILTISSLLFISCSKEDNTTNKNTQQTDKIRQEDNDNPSDTNLTPEEKFSSSILIDFLDDSDDDYLADFLESEIYKRGENYNGTAVVGVTPSTWLISFEKNDTVKNYILQKYVDFKSNEYYFTFKETALTLTDIITQRKSKMPAGE
jgi:hypothetical protein